MRSEPVEFHSDDFRLHGQFFLPDDFAGEPPQPLVIACSGFTGLCHIHPARFARYLTRHGRLCFGFDYRGFADSEGKRGHVLLEEQVRDIRAAVAYAQGDARVDAERVILLGWGMAGGLVIDAARRLPGTVGLIAANGFFIGDRVQQAHRGDKEYQRFLRRVAEARRQQARTGQWPSADPFELYPLDPQSRTYVDEVLRKTPQYDAEPYSFELGESLLLFDVEARAGGMDLPLLIAHGERNALHPTSEAESLYAKWAGPKELFWIKGAGHTEFMHDDDERFLALAGAIDEWIGALLER